MREALYQSGILAGSHWRTMGAMDMTVKELRAAIANLPEDAEIVVRPKDQEEFGDKWRYQTREVANSYEANDDRFTQRRVAVLELGEFHP